MASSPPTALRILLIGAGIFASSAHVSALLPQQHAGRVRIIAVWSRTQRAAVSLAARYGALVAVHHADGNDTFLSAKSTLALLRDQIDAVVLAVPVPQLAAFSRLVLQHGLHLLAEKPLAHSLRAAASLLSDQPAPVSIHAVAENFRFEPALRRARQHVVDICGRVLAVRVSAQTPLPPGSKYAHGWRLCLDQTGLLIDSLVHTVAALRIVLADDIAQVCATCQSLADHIEGPDTVSAALHFSTGVQGILFATYACNAFLWQLRVVGTDADVLVERTFPRPGYRVAQIRKVDAEQCVQEELLPFSGIEAEFDAFVRSCQDGKVCPELDAREAFSDVAVVDALLQSSSLNKWVGVQKLPSSLSKLPLQTTA